jgi:hypothetical protein
MIKSTIYRSFGKKKFEDGTEEISPQSFTKLPKKLLDFLTQHEWKDSKQRIRWRVNLKEFNLSDGTVIEPYSIIITRLPDVTEAQPVEKKKETKKAPEKPKPEKVEAPVKPKAPESVKRKEPSLKERLERPIEIPVIEKVEEPVAPTLKSEKPEERPVLGNEEVLTKATGGEVDHKELMQPVGAMEEAESEEAEDWEEEKETVEPQDETETAAVLGQYAQELAKDEKARKAEKAEKKKSEESEELSI